MRQHHSRNQSASFPSYEGSLPHGSSSAVEHHLPPPSPAVDASGSETLRLNLSSFDVFSVFEAAANLQIFFYRKSMAASRVGTVDIQNSRNDMGISSTNFGLLFCDFIDLCRRRCEICRFRCQSIPFLSKLFFFSLKNRDQEAVDQIHCKIWFISPL